MRLYLDLVAILAVATLSRAQVRLWQGTLTLPTYEKGCLTPVLPSTRVGDREEAEQRYLCEVKVCGTFADTGNREQEFNSGYKAEKECWTGLYFPTRGASPPHEKAEDEG